METRETAARPWIEKATDDLEAAETLLAREPPKTGVAGFHCQQAAEKDLKAFLVYHGQRPPRTHSLEALLDLCVQREEELQELYDAVEPLTPFAVEVRYPDPGLTASREEAAAALRHARQVREAVHACLPF
jgi:HEPN domain-containing protein